MYEVTGELMDKIWYNRHKVREEQIEMGEMPIVEKHTEMFSTQHSIQKDIWEGAVNSAKKLEEKYGIENLGPYSDFEWGMLNGKLSAIRWVLGEEWDMLDI